jgi:hypothetical protein
MQEIFCGRYSIRIAQYIMHKELSQEHLKKENLKKCSGAYAMTGG